MINRLLADTVFAGSDPLGQRVSFQFLPGEWQVVGIVDNERIDDLDRPLLPVRVFRGRSRSSTGSFMIVVRSADTGRGSCDCAPGRQPARSGSAGVRRQDTRAMAAESSAVFLRRATLWMLGIFAAASVMLAALGLYGVLAQGVADRTREIGVRVALGASRGSVVRLVHAPGARGPPVLAPCSASLGTLAASKWLSSLLFGVSPRDPLTIAAATTFLCGRAAACVIPTRRALNIDPATAIRR